MHSIKALCTRRIHGCGLLAVSLLFKKEAIGSLALVLLFAAAGFTQQQSLKPFIPAKSLKQQENAETVKVRAATGKINQLFFEYQIPLAQIKSVSSTRGLEYNEKVVCGNAVFPMAYEGKPILPVVPLTVIIPKGYVIDKVSTQYKKKNALAGAHQVEFGAAKMSYMPGAKVRTAKPDASIYDSDNSYPRQTYELVTVQKKRGVTVAVVNIYPVEYHPKSGKLFSYRDMSVTISLSPEITRASGLDNSGGRVSRGLFEALGVENIDALGTYTGDAGIQRGARANTGAYGGMCDPAGHYPYVAITAQSFITAKTDVTINDLIAWKKNHGIPATVVAIEEVLKNYTGVDDAEKLRNFIKDAYANWETEYVLLGGDVNVIPLRSLYCEASGEVDYIPSDLYFQCLDGNYDSDQDGNWGEPHDGPDGSDVDLMAEVAIGRASAEDEQEMANFVYKTLAYSNEGSAAPFLRNALMVGEYLGFGGVAEYATGTMEEIRLGSDAHGYTTAGFASSPLFTVDTLYDGPGYDWPAQRLIDTIDNGNFGIINHLGHANDGYVMKLYNAEADALTNDHFLFAYSQGCIPGDFSSDCIGEHLTTSTRHGMYAVMFNSRYGWGEFNSTDGPSQRFNRQFWDAYFGEYLFTLGDVNADSHEDNLWDINGECIRWCYYESNLLGDPQTVIRGAHQGPMPVYSCHAMDDSRGNGDGILNPGEQISLALCIRNLGSEEVKNVYAVVSCADPSVTITDNTVAYNDLPCCGAEGWGLDSMSFTLSSECPTPHEIPFTVTVYGNDTGSWTSNFALTAYRSWTVSGGVYAFTGHVPLQQVTVWFFGPMNKTALTDENGLFNTAVIDGQYAVYADAQGYLPGDTMIVTVPPSQQGLEFLFKRPVMQITPAQLTASLDPGQTRTVTMTVANNGDVPLVFNAVPWIKKQEDSAASIQTHGKASEYSVKREKGKPDTRHGPAQLLHTGGPDLYGYIWIDSDEPGGPAFTWQELMGIGEKLPISDYEHTAVDLPFSFPFYGEFFHKLYISANGFAAVQDPGTDDYYNMPIPEPYPPNGLIAPFWTELNISSDSTPESGVYFKAFGDQVVIQYEKVRIPWIGDYAHTFQIVIHSDGTINYYYKQLGGPGAENTTIGIENSTGFDGLQVAYMTKYLHNKMAIAFSQKPLWLSFTPLSAIIDPETSLDITVTMAADTGAIAGAHEGKVVISHNDPQQAVPFMVPATMLVNGTRRLAVNPPSIVCDTTWIGDTKAVALTFKNTGNDTTTIREISIDNSVFTCDALFPLKVLPFGSVTAHVAFAPTVAGPASGTLHVASDALDNPELDVPLAGAGRYGPQGFVAPAELVFDFPFGGAPADKTFVLSNIGKDLLTYAVHARLVSKPQDLLSQLARSAALPPVNETLIYSSLNYKNPHAAGQIIVALKPGLLTISDKVMLAAIKATNVRDLTFARKPNKGTPGYFGRKLFLVSVSAADDAGLIEAIGKLRQSPDVAYAEPNYRYFWDQSRMVPNDSLFGGLWGMDNTGQQGGAADADIDAPEAWSVHTGDRSILIGMDDTGIDYLHPDLAANIWTNPNEIPDNGIDDDGNGYVDDMHGWDFGNQDNDPMDYYGHGSHCSGTVGAQGNNGRGVAGVLWNASLVPVKIGTDDGYLYLSSILEAFAYVAAMDIPVTSNSWGGGAYSQALYDLIAATGLCVCSAGNSSSDNDLYPHYPSSYDCDNIIAVAATDRFDSLAYFSCWGKASVDLGAPGVDILSTLPGGDYGEYSGTSMAGPHVAGAAAFIWSYDPALTYQEVKNILLQSVDTIESLAGKVVSNGRLNLQKAIDLARPAWLSFVPDTCGALQPEGFQQFTVTVDPASMLAGTWKAKLVFDCNDKVLHPAPEVLVTATVAPRPSLVASQDSLSFEKTWIGRDRTMKLTLENSGNTPVTVTGLTIESSCFSALTQTPLKVPAFDARTVEVRFAPADTGICFGQLIIENTSKDNPQIAVACIGKGITGPRIAITPRKVSDTLAGGDSSLTHLTIANTGDDTLRYAVNYLPGLNSSGAVRTAEEKYGPERLRITGKDTADARIGTPVTLGSGGPDSTGYRWVDSDEPGGPAYQWNDISATGTKLTLGYGKQVSVPLSFAFPFYGTSYTHVYVTSAGYVHFLDSQYVRTYNSPIPSQYIPNGIIAPLWSFYYPPVSGTVYVQDFGSEMVIQYTDYYSYYSGEKVTFQVVLSASGVVTCYYKKVFTKMSYYTSGIENQTGYDGLETAFNVPYVKDSLAVRFMRKPEWLTVAPEAGSVAPHTTADIRVLLSAARSLPGIFDAGILFLNNDPSTTGPDTVPVTLTVTPVRHCAGQPLSIDFGKVWIGRDSTGIVELVNRGNAAATVKRITMSNGIFKHGATLPLTIPPFERVGIPVAFRPYTANKTETGTMKFIHDAVEGPVVVSLKGRGIHGPSISLNKKQIALTMDPGDTNRQKITVSNTGGDILKFKAVASINSTLMRSADILANRDAWMTFKLPPTVRPERQIKNRMSAKPAPQGAPQPKPRLFGQSILYATTLITEDSYDPFVEALRVLPEVSQVQVLSCTDKTPAVEYLSQFDVVIVSSMNAWSDPALMGDNCADYVDNGGKLIVLDDAIMDQMPWGLNGRIITPDYLPLQCANKYDYSIGVCTDFVDHPITKNVSLIETLWPILTYATQGNGVALGYYEDGALVGAYNPDKPVVAFNIYPQGIDSGNGDTGSVLYDLVPLVQNTLNWMSGTWLTVSPAGEVSVAPGKTASLTVQCVSAKKNPGTYTGVVYVEHNDDFASQPIEVPVQMKVREKALLAASPASLNLGTVWLTDTTKASILLHNNGNKQTIVSKMTVSMEGLRATFSVPCTLAAFGSASVAVRYTPKSTGTKTGTLTVKNTGANAPNLTVQIKAVVKKGPKMILDKNEISVSVPLHSTAAVPLTITNKGDATLNFAAGVRIDTWITTAIKPAKERYAQYHFVKTRKGAPDKRRDAPSPLSKGGPDGFGYVWCDSDEPGAPAFVWDDIALPANKLDLAQDDDAVYRDVSMPFSFYGDYTFYLSISSNGMVSVNEWSADYFNLPIPSDMWPNSFIAGCWKDLDPSSGGAVYYKESEDKIVVQYDNVPVFGVPVDKGTCTFQIVLHTDGSIQFYYKEMYQDSIGTIGIENYSGDDGLQIAYNNGYVHNNCAVTIRQKSEWLFFEPVAGSVNAGKSLTATVSFDSKNCIAGSYKGFVTLTHNSPNNTPVEIPCVMKVTLPANSGVTKEQEVKVSTK